MAREVKLQQIINAIFQDVTNAKKLADSYSSSKIREEYQKDEFLSCLPVPYIDIPEIEIDLKFAISEVSRDKNAISDRENNIKAIFEKYSSDIVAKATKIMLFDVIEQLETLEQPKLESKSLKDKLLYPQSIPNVHNKLINYLEMLLHGLPDLSSKVDQEIEKINEVIAQLKVIAETSLSRQLFQKETNSSKFINSLKIKLTNFLKTQEQALISMDNESNRETIIKGIYDIFDREFFSLPELNKYVEDIVKVSPEIKQKTPKKINKILNFRESFRSSASAKSLKKQENDKRSEQLIQQIKQVFRQKIHSKINQLLLDISQAMLTNKESANADSIYDVVVYVTTEDLANVSEDQISSIKITTKIGEDKQL